MRAVLRVRKRAFLRVDTYLTRGGALYLQSARKTIPVARTKMTAESRAAEPRQPSAFTSLVPLIVCTPSASRRCTCNRFEGPPWENNSQEKEAKIYGESILVGHRRCISPCESAIRSVNLRFEAIELFACRKDATAHTARRLPPTRSSQVPAIGQGNYVDTGIRKREGGQERWKRIRGF